MKYKKWCRFSTCNIRSTNLNERELIAYRSYFLESEDNIAHLSCPISGFHCIVSRLGEPFSRSRNRKRSMVYYWKNSCFTEYARWFEVDNI